MTSLTKQFIDLDDLTAVVISCSNCKASLTLPLDADRMNLPEICPNCNTTCLCHLRLRFPKPSVSTDSSKRFINSNVRSIQKARYQ
jgi:hypothetical protein